MYFSLFAQKSQSNFDPNISVRLGRVYDIVLDENHPDYAIHKTVGVIRYNIFDEDTFNEDPSNLFMAYPYDSTNVTLPLKGEIVELIGGPRDDEERSDSEYKTYYGR